MGETKPPHEISVPSWLIVAAVLGMGPADTLASHLVTDPGYTELARSIDDLTRQVDQLSVDVERLKTNCD